MDSTCEIIEEGRLTLERLLLNIRMDEELIIINKENDLIAFVRYYLSINRNQIIISDKNIGIAFF